MIDFHTHILPGIDDGSKTIVEAVDMIKKLREQGVTQIMLSPHFYAYKTDVGSFAFERSRAFEHVKEELIKQKVYDMEFYIGSEVLYFDDLWQIENMEKLCILGTKYLILEMPFSKWSDSVMRGVEKIVSKGFTPIIAHFDRYLKAQGGMERVYELLDMGALLQLNCDALLKPIRRRRFLACVKRGLVSALGTDCHDLESRKPEFEKAYSYLKNNLPEDKVRMLHMQEKMIISGAEVFKVK